MKTVGILLAGGLSRRFGSPKAFARLDDLFFYEHVYAALEAACDHVAIVTSPDLQLRFPGGLDVMTDHPEISGQGPLAGIVTAMTNCPAERYVVLPCDMPFVTAREVTGLLKESAESAAVTAVRTGKEFIPLFSVWNGSMAEKILPELDGGRLSVMKFLEKVPVKWVDSASLHADEAIFRNINRPEDSDRKGV